MELIAKFLSDDQTEFISKSLATKLLDIGFEQKDKNFLYFKENEYGFTAIAVSKINFEDPLYTVSVVVKFKETKQSNEEESTVIKTFKTSDSNIREIVDDVLIFVEKHL